MSRQSSKKQSLRVDKTAHAAALVMPALNISDGFEFALSGRDEAKQKTQKSSLIAESKKRTLPRFRESKLPSKGHEVPADLSVSSSKIKTNSDHLSKHF